MITTVFFDLDDTLLDFHKGEAIAIRKALRQMGVEPTEAVVARYSTINQRQWELLEAREITREQVLYRRFDSLYQELGVSRSSRETQTYYEDFLADEAHYLPGSRELLEELAPKYRLYLVSNGTWPVQSRRIASSGIGRYFQDIFISELVGVDKPQKEFFDRCFARIPDFSRENSIIVGDSLTSDIRGGNNAGLLTCWFNPHGKPRREGIRVDHEISRLSQLPGLLSSL